MLPGIVGPTVASVEWVGNRSSSTTIVLQFNQALNSARAQTTSNYMVLTTGKHGLFGKGSKRMIVKSAIYSASSDTVTLHMSRPLNVRRRYQLTVNGSSPRGVSSVGGIMLDLATNDHHGRNYVAILDRNDFVLDLSPGIRQGHEAAADGRHAREGIRRVHAPAKSWTVAPPLR